MKKTTSPVITNPMITNKKNALTVICLHCPASAQDFAVYKTFLLNIQPLGLASLFCLADNRLLSVYLLMEFTPQ